MGPPQTGLRRPSPLLLMSAVLTGTLAGSASLGAQEHERAYEQLVNEFFLLGAVYPQERGEIQLTTYPRIEFDEGYRSVLPLAFEVGLTDRWQVEAEWIPLAVRHPKGLARRSGVGDVELETQYSLMNVGGSDTHLAFGVGMTLPVGSEEAGGSGGETEVEPSLLVARDFRSGARVGQLFGQISLGLPGVGEEMDALASSTPETRELVLGLGYVAGVGRARWIAELSWASDEWDGGENSELLIAPGLVWDLPDSWELGVGLPIGFGGDAAPFAISLFLLYEFELADD